MVWFGRSFTARLFGVDERDIGSQLSQGWCAVQFSYQDLLVFLQNHIKDTFFRALVDPPADSGIALSSTGDSLRRDLIHKRRVRRPGLVFVIGVTRRLLLGASLAFSTLH